MIQVLVAIDGHDELELLIRHLALFGASPRVAAPASRSASTIHPASPVDDAAATAAGISLGPDFKIKFQQYDNFPFTSDGRTFDDVQVTVPALRSLDAYEGALGFLGEGATGDDVDLSLITSFESMSSQELESQPAASRRIKIG